MGINNQTLTMVKSKERNSMRTRAIPYNSNKSSLINIQLYQDANDNFFVGYNIVNDSGTHYAWTSTYTIAIQAINEALRSINLAENNI